MSLFLLAYLVLFVNLGPWWHHAITFGQHDQPETVFNVACACCCHNAFEFDEENNAQSSSIQAPPCNCPVCKFFKQYQVTIEKQSFVISVRIVFEESSLVLVTTPAILVSSSARGPPSRI